MFEGGERWSGVMFWDVQTYSLSNLTISKKIFDIQHCMVRIFHISQDIRYTSYIRDGFEKCDFTTGNKHIILCGLHACSQMHNPLTRKTTDFGPNMNKSTAPGVLKAVASRFKGTPAIRPYVSGVSTHLVGGSLNRSSQTSEQT